MILPGCERFFSYNDTFSVLVRDCNLGSENQDQTAILLQYSELICIELFNENQPGLCTVVNCDLYNQ
jgi:hypothetical protein